MTTPITDKKKEVIASQSDRLVRATLKKKDFYKVFLDILKDKVILEGDHVTLKYSIDITYITDKNQIVVKEG